MSIIEGAVELINKMQQKIKAKELELSGKQWLELDKNLNVARSQLRADARLKDVATLVVKAFKQHSRLKTIFADNITDLTRGTKPASIPLSKSKRRRKVRRNKNVDLDFTDSQHKKIIIGFIQRVEEEAKKASQSANRRVSWLRRSR